MGPEKQWVTVRIGYEHYSLTLSEAEEMIAEGRARIAKGWKDLHFRPTDDFGNSTIALFGDRLETDVEFSQRLLDEARARKSYEERQEEHDRETYERLKKRFEAKS